MHAPASCITTRARDAAPSSSPGRSPRLPQRSSWGWRGICASETWMRAATGGLRGITSRRCGSCCSSRGPTTTSSPRGKPTPCGNCARRRSRTWGSITANMSCTKRKVSARRRPPNWWGTRRKPTASSAGSGRSPSGTSYGRWWTRTSRRSGRNDRIDGKPTARRYAPMITRTTCRVCDGSLEPVLDLGEHFVSDFVSPGDSDGTKAPLELVICRRCRLLQLKHTFPGETMYRNYWYRSGTNQTMRNALADIANKAETLLHLREGDSVVDIGCNDEALRGDRPKIVTSIAMFYDLENPNKFVSDVKTVMDQEGLWIVQMSYLPLMLKTNEFGNICHEHLEYYSLKSFEYLLNLHGFEIVDVELNDINGGSLRAYIRGRNADPSRFADATYRELSAERVQSLREQEVRLGLDDIDVYREFAVWVNRIKEDVVGFIKEQVARGKKGYVYGASTKGNTLLQYFGLDRTLITAAAERNRDKWGKETVGTRIPIVSEEEARAAKPDYFLVLPWHFLEEFRLREKAYLLSGGKFIVPMPHFTLI